MLMNIVLDTDIPFNMPYWIRICCCAEYLRDFNVRMSNLCIFPLFLSLFVPRQPGWWNACFHYLIPGLLVTVGGSYWRYMSSGRSINMCLTFHTYPCMINMLPNYCVMLLVHLFIYSLERTKLPPNMPLGDIKYSVNTQWQWLPHGTVLIISAGYEKSTK